jgi:hypothetical protein
MTGCGASGSSPILAWACPPPPKRRSLDADLQRLFAISDLLHYHFSRQIFLIGGDSVLFADDHVLAFGRFSLFRSDQHIGVFQINGRLRLNGFLSTCITLRLNGRLDLSTKNITIISSMRKRVVPPTISFLF